MTMKNDLPSTLTVTVCRECEAPISVKHTECRQGCEYSRIGYSKRPITHRRYKVELLEVIHEGPEKEVNHENPS